MVAFIYDKKKTGLFIQDLRVKVRYTQDGLAEQAGCSQRTIADIEGGTVGMSIELMLSLCNVLRTTPDQMLLGGKNDEEIWLVKIFANLSPEQKKVAMEIVRPYIESLSTQKNDL